MNEAVVETVEIVGKSCLSGGFRGGGISSRDNRGQKWASAGCFQVQGDA